MIGSALFRWMDARALLGFDVWEFSVRSLGRRYGKLFLGSVVLRHPWRTLAGLRAHAARVRRSRHSGVARVNAPSETFSSELADGEWLVGIGFCQKPLNPLCPSGRFNHRCWLAGQPPEIEPHPACRQCQVREVLHHALPAGATVHIMTSAADLAQDLLLPGLRRAGPRSVVLSLCPYSVAPMTLALAICGLRGLVLSYDRGDCRDFASWVRADEGDKPERTFLLPDTHRRLLGLLDEVADLRTERSRPQPGRFREQGNLYVPSF